LRRIHSELGTFRLPFGPVFSVLGVFICVVLLTQMELRQVLLMGITGIIAAANWWWARLTDSRTAQTQTLAKFENPAA